LIHERFDILVPGNWVEGKPELTGLRTAESHLDVAESPRCIIFILVVDPELPPASRSIVTLRSMVPVDFDQEFLKDHDQFLGPLVTAEYPHEVGLLRPAPESAGQAPILKCLPSGWMDELRIDIQHTSVRQGPMEVPLGFRTERLSVTNPVGDAASNPGRERKPGTSAPLGLASSDLPEKLRGWLRAGHSESWVQVDRLMRLIS
jgi:hypothetical protein